MYHAACALYSLQFLLDFATCISIVQSLSPCKQWHIKVSTCMYLWFWWMGLLTSTQNSKWKLLSQNSISLRALVSMVCPMKQKCVVFTLPKLRPSCSKSIMASKCKVKAIAHSQIYNPLPKATAKSIFDKVWYQILPSVTIQRQTMTPVVLKSGCTIGAMSFDFESRYQSWSFDTSLGKSPIVKLPL